MFAHPPPPESTEAALHMRVSVAWDRLKQADGKWHFA